METCSLNALPPASAAGGDEQRWEHVEQFARECNLARRRARRWGRPPGLPGGVGAPDFHHEHEVGKDAAQAL